MKTGRTIQEMAVELQRQSEAKADYLVNTGLLSYNVNRWFQRMPEQQRMIRTMDGRARAFLSNRYRRIDNIDIAKIALPIIGEMPDARFESCQITEDYMYLKVVNPRLTAEVVSGDIVQAGVVISNSETGLGAVCIQPLVFRLVLQRHGGQRGQGPPQPCGPGQQHR